MPTTIIVPQLGESVVEGTIGKWLKKVGDPIAKDEPIVEIITDKINIELPSPLAGTLGRITVAEGVVAQVGDELGVILAAGESLGASASAPSAAAPAPSHATPASYTPAPSYAPASSATATLPSPSSSDGMRLSPAVRKLVKEHGVEVAQIRGSGMGGRVTREDVLTHLDARKLSPG